MNRKKTKEEFIKNAVIVHSNLYDYSFIEYHGNKIKICINCFKHGQFWQTPNNHLRGNKCKKCSLEELSKLQNKGKEQFIVDAIKIHNNLYDYSNVIYKNSFTKLKLLCNRCNKLFYIRPHDHLSKKVGCAACAAKNFVSALETKWLDELGIEFKNRQIYINLRNYTFLVDGFDSKTKTIYEFFGDYWHGNPKKYEKNKINKKCNTTFGELYDKTMNRIKIFNEYGYKVIYIWENEYLNQIKKNQIS